MRRCAASLPPMSGRIAPAMIVSGMRAVSALDASATARSKPATRWKRLIARSTNAGRSQNVSVRSTRSRSIRGLVSITGGRSSSAALAAPRRCRRECRPRSAPRPGGAHHLRRGCGRPAGGGLVVAPRWRPTRPLGSAHARVPGPGRIGRVTAALGWGALAASSLVIGALLGMARDWPPRLVGLVLAFGAGALISAVSFDLAEEGARLGDAGVVAGGLAAGAITYFALDRVVGRRSASRGGRARAAPAPPSPSAPSSTASRSRRSSASGSRRARGSASACSSRSSSRTCRRRSGRPARCTPRAPGRRRSAACGSSSR